MMFKEMTNLTIQIIKQDIGPHANSYGPLRQTWQVDTGLLILIGGGILWWWWWWRQWREDFGFEWHMDGYLGTNEGWDKNAWIKAVGSNRGCKLPPQEGFTWWCFSRLIRQNLELPKLELNSSDHQGGIFFPKFGHSASPQRWDGDDTGCIQMENVRAGEWKGQMRQDGGCFSALPACWGGGGAGCRHTTSAPPPELGSASQTASPAPAPRPAGRPYSHTAPFTRWEQSTGQDRAGSTPDRRRDSTNTGI